MTLSNHTNCSEELNLQDLLQQHENDKIEGEQIRMETDRMLQCPVLQRQKNVALEDHEEHLESVELAIEDSKQFRQKMEQSMKKIEASLEHVTQELADLKKRRAEYDAQSENGYLCPEAGIGSWWNPCRKLQKLFVTVLLFSFLIAIIVLIVSLRR